MHCSLSPISPPLTRGLYEWTRGGGWDGNKHFTANSCKQLQKIKLYSVVVKLALLTWKLYQTKNGYIINISEYFVNCRLYELSSNIMHLRCIVKRSVRCSGKITFVVIMDLWSFWVVVMKCRDTFRIILMIFDLSHWLHIYVLMVQH